MKCLPGNNSTPIVCHEGALGVPKLLDQVDDVLGQFIKGVVHLVGWTLGVPVPPHVDGDNSILFAELTNLVTPGKPELWDSK